MVMNDNQLRGLGVPVALQQSFRRSHFHFTRMLVLDSVAFTRIEAEFLRDFLQGHPLAVNWLVFHSCTFNSGDNDDGCLDILKDCFAAPALRMNGGLRVEVTSLNKDAIDASWFPAVSGFATVLSITNCFLDDADFKRAVDIILGGNGKKNLKWLCIDQNRLSPNSLVDATRLLEHSQLEALWMNDNLGLLDNQEQVRLLCNKLQKNKFLTAIELSCCEASEVTVNTITTMLVDSVLATVNTTLRHVAMDQNINPSENDHFNQRRLATWTSRNERLGKVLAGVKGLLHPNNSNNNNENNNQLQQRQQLNVNNNEESHIITIANEGSWRLILNAAMENVDRDRSALYLLMCKAIVGDQACPLHSKVVDFLKMSSSSSL